MVLKVVNNWRNSTALSGQEKIHQCVRESMQSLGILLERAGLTSLVGPAEEMITYSVGLMNVKASTTEKGRVIMAVCAYLAIIISGDKNPSRDKMEQILCIFEVDIRRFTSMYRTLREKVAPKCNLMRTAMSFSDIFDHSEMQSTIYEFVMRSVDILGIRLDDRLKINGRDTPTNRLVRAVSNTAQQVVNIISRFRSGRNPELMMKCVVQFIINEHPGLRAIAKAKVIVGCKDITRAVLQFGVKTEYLKEVTNLCSKRGNMNPADIDGVLKMYADIVNCRRPPPCPPSPPCFLPNPPCKHKNPPPRDCIVISSKTGRVVSIDSIMFPGAKRVIVRSLKRNDLPSASSAAPVVMMPVRKNLLSPSESSSQPKLDYPDDLFADLFANL
eukprot:gene28552-31712_t